MDDDATVVVDRSREPRRSTQSADALALGSLVNNRFVIEAEIGKGGMGIVYRAKDLRKEETRDRDPYVALKVLGDQFRQDPLMVVALQRESRKAQTLAHPNIATVYDFDRDGDIVYLTMEELAGEPLDEAIASRPDGFDRVVALRIIRGLCLGLAYAHNKNIVHSDFKPGNVFLTDNQQTKILDFGIARAVPTKLEEQNKASAETQFDAGTLGALTPAYASCEMFEGADPHPADDVYALAVVAYELLSGRHPFNAIAGPLARRDGLEPLPIKGLKRREWRALRHGLAFERSQRTQHAADFLREFEGGSRLKVAIGATVVLGLIFAGYIGYVQFQESARAAPDIPFDELTLQVQQDITRALDEGDTLRQFGDAGSALMMYRQAYELHPRNPGAVERIETLFVALARTAIMNNDEAGLQRLAENLEAVMAIDDFLGNRPELLDTRLEVARTTE